MSLFWDQEEVFLDGDQYFDRLIQDIESARESITVEVYIFNDDQFGRIVAEHLIRAQARGVKVQIIVDGVGSYNFYMNLHRQFVKADVQVKVYNPLPFYHPFFGKLGFRKKLSALSFRLWRINRRDHRKIITIDEKILYMGSFNITAEHTKYHHETKWKDIGVRVNGSHVRFAVLNFKRIWKLRDYLRYLKIFRKTEVGFKWRNSPLRMNHTLISKNFYQRDLTKRFKQSTERIWLTTPYFIPTRKTIRILGKAAKRGVDVKILISSRTDVGLFRTLRYFYYPYLLKKGVRIFEYGDTVLHAKCFIIDNWITLGSSNLNHRSLLHDLEVDLSVQEQKNKDMILQDFVNSTKTQAEITTEHLKLRSVFDRFLARLLFLFKYWF